MDLWVRPVRLIEIIQEDTASAGYVYVELFQLQRGLAESGSKIDTGSLKIASIHPVPQNIYTVHLLHISILVARDFLGGWETSDPQR